MLTTSQQLKLNELNQAIRISFAHYMKFKTYESEINWRYWYQEKLNFIASVCEEHTIIDNDLY